MNGNATPEAIHYALNTLDTEFAHIENLRFNHFILRLQENLDSAEANMGKVLGKIMSLRALSADQIGPDPANSIQTGDNQSAADNIANSMVGSTPASNKSVAKPVGRHKVFATVMETIVMHLRNRGDDSHLHLIDQILQTREVVDAGPRLVDALNAWRAAPVPDGLRITGTQDEYRAMVHRSYIWLCEKFGPVDADRTLNAAIGPAESMPEAFNHPPRDLL